jgi:hypothetical protein
MANNKNTGPDATEQSDRKLRRACDWVEQQLDDRWPSRGRANQVDREWPPRDVVSRHGRLEQYRKWPSARS